MNKIRKFPGLFIVFEGLDGTGKTTQIKKLFSLLTEKDYPVVSLYQPTHGFWGTKLRELFIKGHIVPTYEEIQYSINDRRESVERDIIPALQTKNIVLLDRYYWSNAAYQGVLDVPYQKILELNKEFPEPDIIIYFDIEVETAFKRILDKRNEIPNQFEAIDSLIKSKTIFQKIITSKSFSGSLITVQAEKDSETIFELICCNILPLIESWNEN
jgi:dTMP kinase